MAARLNPRNTESVLQKIKTSQLLNRLQNHALGTLKNEVTDEPMQMTDSQVRATQFLIERTLAKAVNPLDLNVQGNLTCVFRDPTDRPAQMNGYHRKPELRDGD